VVLRNTWHQRYLVRASVIHKIQGWRYFEEEVGAVGEGGGGRGDQVNLHHVVLCVVLEGSDIFSKCSTDRLQNCLHPQCIREVKNF